MFAAEKLSNKTLMPSAKKAAAAEAVKMMIMMMMCVFFCSTIKRAISKDLKRDKS